MIVILNGSKWWAIFYWFLLCLKVKVTQSCLTLCAHMDSSPPGSSVHGILQARILELVASPFFMGSSPPRDWSTGSTATYCRQFLYCLSQQGRSLILVKWRFYSTSICVILLKHGTFQFRTLKSIVCDVAFYKIILTFMG